MQKERKMVPNRSITKMEGCKKKYHINKGKNMACRNILMVMANYKQKLNTKITKGMVCQEPFIVKNIQMMILI